MAKFIYQDRTATHRNFYFGEANAYGCGEDVRLDYDSEIFCVSYPYSNTASVEPNRNRNVSFGKIQDFSDAPYLGSKILGDLFKGVKVDEYVYEHLCAFAASMLIAQSQKLLASAGMASNANITIPSDHLKAASEAARQILKPGTPGASLTILSKQPQESVEVYNPAIGCFDNIEASMYHGEAVN